MSCTPPKYTLGEPLLSPALRVLSCDTCNTDTRRCHQSHLTDNPHDFHPWLLCTEYTSHGYTCKHLLYVLHENDCFVWFLEKKCNVFQYCSFGYFRGGFINSVKIYQLNYANSRGIWRGWEICGGLIWRGWQICGGLIWRGWQICGGLIWRGDRYVVV